MTTKKSTTKPAAAKKAQSAAAELTYRLGPIMPVVKMARASDTKAAYRLHLKCGHVRVGTARKRVRCGKCRSAAKK